MEVIALKTILWFSVIFLIVSFVTLDLKGEVANMYIRVMHCVFFGAIVCMAMSGLGLYGF